IPQPHPAVTSDREHASAVGQKRYSIDALIVTTDDSKVLAFRNIPKPQRRVRAASYRSTPIRRDSYASHGTPVIVRKQRRTGSLEIPPDQGVLIGFLCQGSEPAQDGVAF